MSERLRQGLQQRNKREKGGRPPKGKDQAEREKLSQTRCLSEGHSKRAGSPRPPRESSGRGRSLTQRRCLQAQKTTCWREAVQSRWTWKRTFGQESTMERSKNLPRPAASVRTTRKEGASGCRAQSWATDRGSNPSRQELGQGTKYNPRPVARVGEATLNPNMGQWRTLERAKDNRSSWTQRGPPGNTPWGTGHAETLQTEVWGPSRNWPVCLTQMGTLNLRSDRGQTILDPAGVTPSRR